MLGSICWNKEDVILQAGKQKTKFREYLCHEITDGLEVVCEGVILNLQNAAISGEPIAKTLARMYRSAEDPLSDSLFGEYAFCIVDREQKTALILNDRLSKKSVFYSIQGNTLYFSTSFFELVSYLRKRKAALHPDPIGISMMKYYGVFTDAYTYFKEIRWLKAYEMISISQKKIEILSNKPVFSFNYHGDIQQINHYFSEGCRLQCELNRKHGYQQVFTISGGMDSRAVLLTSKALQYSPDLTFTYAESGSTDQFIASKIASDEKVRNVFFALDNGRFLFEREQIVDANEGQMTYEGSTGAYDAANLLDVSNIGVVHSGIGGGEIFGDDCRTEAESYAMFERYVGGLHLGTEDANRLNEFLHKAYSNYNEFIMLNDIRRCMNFSKSTSGRFVAMSPFLYEPFFEYLLQIDFAEKQGRKLYKAWYREYLKTDENATSAPGGFRDDRVGQWINRFGWLKKRIGVHFCEKLGIKSKQDMNPLDYWVENNPDLQEYLKQCEREDLEDLENKELEPELLQMLSTAETDAPVIRLSVMTARQVFRICYE